MTRPDISLIRSEKRNLDNMLALLLIELARRKTPKTTVASAVYRRLWLKAQDEYRQLYPDWELPKAPSELIDALRKAVGN